MYIQYGCKWLCMFIKNKFCNTHLFLSRPLTMMNIQIWTFERRLREPPSGHTKAKHQQSNTGYKNNAVKHNTNNINWNTKHHNVLPAIIMTTIIQWQAHSMYHLFQQILNKHRVWRLWTWRFIFYFQRNAWLLKTGSLTGNFLFFKKFEFILTRTETGHCSGWAVTLTLFHPFPQVWHIDSNL